MVQWTMGNIFLEYFFTNSEESHEEIIDMCKGMKEVLMREEE